MNNLSKSEENTKLLSHLQFILLVFILKLLLQTNGYSQESLYEKIQNLGDVVSVDSIFTDTIFTEQYDVYFNQYLDHKNPESGSFKQRVIVGHLDYDNPVVAVLEGYSIWNGRAEELSLLMQCNQVNIEHRFFKNSKPDSIPWEKLTIWQAATDQHKIIKALQTIYSNNWLTTGISKGGQTTMYHRSFYPDDVTASVPYVAPLNYKREDERIYKFFKTVGTDEERQKIYEFQCLCFENTDTLVSMLKEKSEAVGWAFKFGYNKAVVYTILEYNFAYWQWGNYSIRDIPDSSATALDLFNHLNTVADFTFFEDRSVETYHPFFWAALTEIGMYGYETKPFERYLGDTIYTFDFSAPKSTNPVYNKKAMQDVKEYLDTDAKNMLFIVGGMDTWSATAYQPSGKNNLVNKTLATGHHGTRIKHFPPEEREEIYQLLENWMDVKIEDIFE